MKKSLGLTALFAFFLLTVSAHSERVFEAAEGYSAPLFTVNVGDSTLSLDQINKGHYVLLTFWDSQSAESRVKVNQYDAIASANDKLQLLAVNLDSNERLFQATRKIDSLNNGVHFNLTPADREKINSLYHFDEGLNSYLIGPDGKIIAVNPDLDKLNI